MIITVKVHRELGYETKDYYFIVHPYDQPSKNSLSSFKNHAQVND